MVSIKQAVAQIGGRGPLLRRDISRLFRRCRAPRTGGLSWQITPPAPTEAITDPDFAA